jgi:hypothetical protein
MEDWRWEIGPKRQEARAMSNERRPITRENLKARSFAALRMTELARREKQDGFRGLLGF